MKTYDCEDLGTVYLIETTSDVDHALALLATDKPIAFDTETSGLLPYAVDSQLRLAQLGTTDEAYVWEPHHFPDLTRKAVTTRPVWYWNAAFDRLWLDAHMSIGLRDTFPHAKDAGILHRLIDPRDQRTGGTGHGLKEVCDEWLDLNVGDARKIVQDHARKTYKLKKDEFWSSIPTDDPIYITYAGQDVLLTSRIGELLNSIIDHPSVAQGKIADFEHTLADCMAHVTRRGWKVDREHTATVKERLQAEFREQELKVAEFGITPVKGSGLYSTSDASLIDTFSSLGVTFTEFTSTGKPSLSEKVLSDIASHDDRAAELAGHVLAARKANKLANTFLTNVEKYSEFDNRIHAFIKPLGTVTGRMSSSEPNMQNFPREPSDIRGCMIADDGHVHIAIDYSGCEWRAAAAVTQDAGMLDAFEQGRDIHQETADMLGISRQLAKTASLAVLYGGGVNAIVNQCGISEELATELRDGIHSAYPGIRERVNENYKFVEAEQERTGVKDVRYTYVTGRQILVDSGYPLGNYGIQGPARDIIAEAVVRVFEAGYGDYMRGVIHDEIVFSAPEDRAEELLSELRSIMEVQDWLGLGVDIVADGNILGKHWRKS